MPSVVVVFTGRAADIWTILRAHPRATDNEILRVLILASGEFAQNVGVANVANAIDRKRRDPRWDD